MITLGSVFTADIWPMIAALFLMLFLAGYSWRHRSVPGALPFMMGCLFSFLITIGIVMAYLAFEAQARDFWLRFQFAWMAPAATAITCFVLEYTWPGRWLTRRNLILLSILPLFFFFTSLQGVTPFTGRLLSSWMKREFCRSLRPI
jgi:hypothetical protein